MRNIFKFKIPSGSTKEVECIESWTVKFVTAKSKHGYHCGDLLYLTPKYKCFTSKEDAKLFQQQIESAANLIETHIDTELYSND